MGPEPPVVTSSSVYEPCVSGGSCLLLGGPNQAGSFTFGVGANGTSTHYSYKFSYDDAWSEWTAIDDGSFTVGVLPPTSGTFSLDVQAKDAQGRVRTTTVTFRVKPGSAPVGRWDFNETAGVAVDRSTSDPALRHDLTLASAGTSRTDHGRRGELTAPDGTKTQDKALALSRTSQGAAWTAEQVVDTQSSYTVTAWARPGTSGTENLTVLAQDGSHQSAFSLGYCGDVRTWCAQLPDKDTADSGGDTRRVNALHAPQPGAWTHLGLVVDNATKKVHLYVNGDPQGSADIAAPLWSSAGGLQVGRAKYAAGSYADHFPGEIDEMTVWQRPLSPQEMATEAGLVGEGGHASVELVASYDPAGITGSSLPDGSGYGNTLTLASTTSLNGETIGLGGVDDFGSTERPLVDDTGSFTVATAVTVDTEKLYDMPNGSRMQVLGQQTTAGSSWAIWFEKVGMIDDTSTPPVIDEETGELIFQKVPGGLWHFGRLASDGTGVSVSSQQVLTPRGEIGLTGVYDATTRTIALYTNGDQQHDRKAYQATIGSGFTVGKSWTGGHLPGRISDIRVWAGALSGPQQVSDVVGY
ncbi:LamG domain-containing protein [Streptomyces laurentii]|uniref:LamG domain-containing protein n=1 Tax=Streptomyces laurentii TaxID=39478 RepID=UPI00369DACCC